MVLTSAQELVEGVPLVAHKRDLAIASKLLRDLREGRAKKISGSELEARLAALEKQ